MRVSHFPRHVMQTPTKQCTKREDSDSIPSLPFLLVSTQRLYLLLQSRIPLCCPLIPHGCATSASVRGKGATPIYFYLFGAAPRLSLDFKHFLFAQLNELPHVGVYCETKQIQASDRKDSA